MDKYDLANQVLNAKTPKQAKFIAQRIPEIELSSKGWHSQKYNVMEETLYAKVNSCTQFKRALLDYTDLVLIEGTTDEYWGIGQSAYYIATTHPDFLYGRNMLEEILMDIRHELFSEINNHNHHQHRSQEDNANSEMDMSAASERLLAQDCILSVSGPPTSSTPEAVSSDVDSNVTLNQSAMATQVSPDCSPVCSLIDITTSSTPVSTQETHGIMNSLPNQATTAVKDDITNKQHTYTTLHTHYIHTTYTTLCSPHSDSNANLPLDLSTSIITSVVRQFMDENRTIERSSSSTSLVDEFNELMSEASEEHDGQNPSRDMTTPKPAPRRILIGQLSTSTTKKKKQSSKCSSKNSKMKTPSNKNTIDYFLSGASTTVKRKLSPDKVADTEDNEVKSARSEDQKDI